MEKIINVMFLLLFCATLFAQNTDTTAVAKADTIVPKKTTELPEVGITAKKPVCAAERAGRGGRCGGQYHPARSLIGTDMA